MCFAVAVAAPVTAEVVPFKDANRIRSRDAWNDHKRPEPKKEKLCVTWEKLCKLDCGLEPFGVLETRPAKDIFGCRFAGQARPWVIGPCAKYCDVVSYNIYRDQIDDWRLPDGLDAPVLIGLMSRLSRLSAKSAIRCTRRG